MIENLFGKDNDMMVWMFLILMMCGGCGSGSGGFNDEWIWIILLFMLFNNNGCKRC